MKAFQNKYPEVIFIMSDLTQTNISFVRFIKFIIPSILSMVFISFYSAVDGFFLANYVSSNALAAINIVLPYLNFVWGLAVMLATGSSALVGIKIGEGDVREASRNFTLALLFTIGASCVVLVLSLLNLDSIVRYMGATSILFADAKLYLIMIVLSAPILTSKLFLEYYIRLDGSPMFSLFTSFIGLLLNIVFNYYTVVVLNMGVFGSALATVIAVTISLVFCVLYFTHYSKILKFAKTKWQGSFIKHSLTNGSSEMLTEISSGIVAIIFNLTVVAYAGENGLAAIAIIINIFYFLISIYLGIATGAQPLISCNYGAHNTKMLSKILKYSKLCIIISSVLVFAVALYNGASIIKWYVGGDNVAVLRIATDGFKLFSLCFLFLGVNIFISGLYTSIGNGLVSAIISAARSLVFVCIALFILPKLMGLKGVWLAIPVAEACTLIMSIGFYKMFVKNHL